jgi:3-mercaptopyruvate sulfurtransferase SseA
VLDVRKPELYSAGHIPRTINVPEGEWYVNHPGPIPPPWMELPPEEKLFELIGDAGITSDSRVVVVGSTSGSLNPMILLALYGVAGATRVAITLLYAGLETLPS